MKAHFRLGCDVGGQWHFPSRAWFPLALLFLLCLDRVSLRAQDLNPNLELNPVSPTSNDAITYKLGGTWLNGCVPQSPKIRVSAAEVRIETSNPATICTEALAPWSLTGSIGELAPGAYTVIAVYSGPSVPAPVEIIRKALTVSASLQSNEVILAIVANGAFAPDLHYQTIFTVLNTTTQSVTATLQVFSNAGTPGGVFCSPLAPPPASVTASIKPGAQLFQFTSADLPFSDGWARLSWDGPSSLLASEEVTMVAAPPAPCLLICNFPSTAKISSAQVTGIRAARAFRLPVTLNKYRQTALALVNPSATDTITVTVSILDAAGEGAALGVPATFDVKVGPRERISKFLWQMALEHSALTVILPVPESFQGSVTLTSDGLFGVGALNIMFPEGKFVTVPVMPAAR